MGKVAEGQVKDDLASLVEFFLLCLILFYTRYIRECVMNACVKVSPRLAKDWGLNLYL